MNLLAISKCNSRIAITISKNLKKKLEKVCEEEQRSISNLCSKVLSDYINSRKVNRNENSNIQ